MYKLPLKFILLWVLNMAVLVGLGVLLDIRIFPYIRDAELFCLVLGGILALLEQHLFDKLRGN